MLYGERGLHAIEVKRTARVTEAGLRGLRLFLADYPQAKARLLHGGTRRSHDGGIDLVPIAEALPELHAWLS